jgi:hypothetical protein
MGWTNPDWSTACIGGGAVLLAFVVIETRVGEPMIQLSLFRIRAFTAGNWPAFAVSIARGGLQFMLIIWLQGIWLPLHGYNYPDSPVGRYLLAAPHRGLPRLGSGGRNALGPVRIPRPGLHRAWPCSPAASSA